MRITRLQISGFRGWEQLDLRPNGHVVLAGVPRAGRTDIIEALARVLDPDAARSASLTDLHPDVTESVDGTEAHDDAAENAADPITATPLVHVAEIEVTLTDLDPDVEQLVEGALEPLDPSGAASKSDDADPNAPQCVRLAYRLSYDSESEVLETLVFYPARSNPAIGQFMRVPATTRRALPVITLNTGVPLQLRAGGNLRRFIDVRDPKAATAAFERLRDAVAAAVSELSSDPAVTEAVEAVLAIGGTGNRLGDTTVTPRDVGFLAEDGTVAALLRTLRAALRLDTAGMLTLANHGSTVTAVLSMAEALLLATVPGGVILADDFGDQLDAATTEHLASLTRNQAGQVWLSTRRPEATRAFEPGEVVRLTSHGGVRAHHQIARITDRKKLAAMRQLHTQLLPALTAPAVAITEGPHDVAVLNMADRRYPPAKLPLSAHGVRLVAAGTGGDGGIDQIPRVADLAKQLGFRIIGVVDRDKDTPQSAEQLARVTASCDVVVRLPQGAIEQAMLAGIDLAKIAAASATLTDYQIPDPLADGASDAVVRQLCKALHKQSLHEPMLEALYSELRPAPGPTAPDQLQPMPAVHPPVLAAVLDAIAAAASPTYNGPDLIDVPEVSRPQLEEG
ncbi:hypothetical protein [Spirillospora sp. NBC_01491]|uniref:hypothetical protein n=1 Tax=Spirillospora sp. NBC_01491 TaxID=2976007 RepID=UPI002E35A93B|nr:hypothetical protein [Spirillospora sp. NBC_01491]